MRELFEDILPSLFLLNLVDAGRHEGYEAASPHAGATRDNVGGKCGTDVVNELSGGIEALTSVTEKTRSIGLGIQVEKKRSVHNSQTAVEYIETILQLDWREREKVCLHKLHAASWRSTST